MVEGYGQNLLISSLYTLGLEVSPGNGFIEGGGIPKGFSQKGKNNMSWGKWEGGFSKHLSKCSCPGCDTDPRCCYRLRKPGKLIFSLAWGKERRRFETRGVRRGQETSFRDP